MDKIHCEWETDIDHKKISLPVAYFVFNQAEKRLQDLLTISSELVTRTGILIGFQITLLTGCIGYAISINEGKPLLFFSLTLTSLYLFFSLLLAQKNLRYRQYPGIGARPKEILLHDYFAGDSDKQKEDAELFILIREFEYYQTSIQKSSEINRKRASKFNLSLVLTLLTPLILLISYFIFLLLSCYPL